jgi:outer membrane receptor for monomeric catechols
LLRIVITALVNPLCCMLGQLPPPPAESPSAAAPAAPAPAAAPGTAPAGGSPAAPKAAAREDVIRLNPFEIQADSNKSYGAPASNSITGFSADLDKLPIGADIFDEAFMRDVGATGVEDMIQAYSAGAGFAAADPASAAANRQPGDWNGAALQLRGLASPSMVRDGFMQVGSYFNPGSTGAGFSSNFDVERVEVINGPQSILYGASGGGGVVNTVSKQARLGQPAFGSFFWRFDHYGNKQGIVDYGVGTDTVAARVSVINQDVAGRTAGWAGPNNATFDFQPRSYVFSNTISF